MAHNEKSESKAQAKHDKSVFVLGVVRIEIPNGVLVEEYGLCLLKRHAMFAPVLAILGLIPFELYATHMYNIHIPSGIGKVHLLVGDAKTSLLRED
jgi:hypothetical protein